MCGPLNLQLVATDKWNTVQKLAQEASGLKNIDLSYLNSEYAPQDTELGQMVENMYIAAKGNEEMRQSMYKTVGTVSGSVENRDTFQNSSQNMLKQANKTNPSQMDMIKEENDQSKTPLPPQERVIPNWHTLKLSMMGKAYSGKKTQIQMIKDQYGDKIHTFSMDEIIREALSFV